MTLSLTALLSFIVCTSACIVLIGCLCKETILKRVGIYSFLALCFVTIARLFFPFEMPFAVSVPIGGVYTSLVLAMRTPILTVGAYDLTFIDIAVGVWAMGSVFLLIKTGVMSYRFKKSILAGSTGVINANTVKCLQEAVAKHGCKANVTLIQSPQVKVPFTMGALKPRVVIPNIRLSEDQWSYVFDHEITHYMKGDLWIKGIVEFLVILYWWNPVVYFFRNRISMALEMRVDHCVSRSLPEFDRYEYVQTILAVAKNNSKGVAGKKRFAVGIDGTGGQSVLMTRTKFIVEIPASNPKATRRKTYASALLAVLLMFVTCFFVFEPYIVTSEVVEESYVLGGDNSYIIVNDDGFYDIYIDNVHIGTTKEIQDSFSNLRVYENGKVEKHE